MVVNLGFVDRSRYFFFQVAPQLWSRGWVDPVPDPLLVRKSGRAGNRTRDLWLCSQKLWPLDRQIRGYKFIPKTFKLEWIFLMLFVRLLSPLSSWNSLDHTFSFIFMSFSFSFLLMFPSLSFSRFLSYELCRWAVKWKEMEVIYGICRHFLMMYYMNCVRLYSVTARPHILYDAIEVHRRQFVSLFVRLRNFIRSFSSCVMFCGPSCSRSLIHNHVLRSGKSGTPFT
jgi:hypothetical protein